MQGGFSGTVANISTTINSLNNFNNESVYFTALNENKGANYNNWIQHKNVRKCKRIWYTFWIGKECWYVWGSKTTSSYKEVKASKNSFTKTYSN
jgi:hypothetical protein